MAATHLYSGIAANCSIRTKGEVRSYEQAVAFLGNDLHKTLGKNVQVRRAGPNAVKIRLYDTDILTYHADGTFEADNGGFPTITTSTRLRQFGPPGWYFNHGNFKLYGRINYGVGLLMGPGRRYTVTGELQESQNDA